MMPGMTATQKTDRKSWTRVASTRRPERAENRPTVSSDWRSPKAAPRRWAVRCRPRARRGRTADTLPDTIQYARSQQATDVRSQREQRLGQRAQSISEQDQRFSPPHIIAEDARKDFDQECEGPRRALPRCRRRRCRLRAS